MKYNWNDEKNKILQKKRQISFEKIVEAINKNQILDITDNPSINHPNQKIYIINIDNYIYIVPFVINKDGTKFLKTIYKSRKETKKYIRGKK
ncbi:MAG: BrnT family toxin [Elusimicrobiota bacterium]|jgi:uncharacterized DUF497 family protein|nr:BrnT family toxin [Elusimicrobiota bacterium]